MELQFILGVLGMPFIDESLKGLMEAMHKVPTGLGPLTAIAKSVGCCIALGVGANECYQMMLGKRGMDVMKIMHILIISLCITFSGAIISAAKEPGLALEKYAMSSMQGINAEVIVKEKEVAKLQNDYINKVNEVLANAQLAEKAQREDTINPIKHVEYAIDDFKAEAKAGLMKMAMYTESKLCEWFSLIIRFIGEIIFQMSYYGMLVAQRVFMAILGMFCPIMFAISLSPHYKSAWSQWLSKYLSLSLWSFITYMVIYYVNFILMHNLTKDITTYQGMITDASKAGATAGWEQVGTLGMQGLGSTCMYVMALMAGAYIIRMVPEVASWCIPGGVSSGAGEKSGALGMGAVAAVPGIAGGAVGAASTAATWTTKVAGTIHHGGGGTYGGGAGVLSAVAQNTGLGRAYDAGRQRGHSGASPNAVNSIGPKNP